MNHFKWMYYRTLYGGIFYDDLVDNGINIANEYNAEYKYIECRVEDFEILNNRLKSRERSVSQIESTEKESFLEALEKSKRPTKTEHLIVDSSLPIEAYIQKVLKYIGEIY